MTKVTVTLAEPYEDSQMWSTGKASGMLISQYEFPHVYDVRETLLSVDLDRLDMHERERVRACLQKHHVGGPVGIGSWARWQADEREVFDLLKELLDPEGKTAWTGCRILGTVNRSNGNPVYSLQLFAKLPGTSTPVYTGDEAPNILPGRRHDR